MSRSTGLALAALLAFATIPAHATLNEAAILAEKPPGMLSEFGFFDDPKGQKPTDGLVPYDLNTPLFSDGALKYRFVHIPEGRSARYDPVEAFDFPVGSALVKTFAFPADYRQPDKDVRLIETRVLERHADGWRTWAYVWNEEQTDAVLKIAGAHVDIAATGADGKPIAFTYAVPNKNQCKGCHAINGEVTPLGPKARNLNKAYPYADGPENQLAHWAALGLLAGAPSPVDVPAVPDWRDETAPLDRRARAWLDVNCAHCHRPEGPASNSGLYLLFDEKEPVKYGVMKRPVAAGKGSGDRQFDIVPGDPDASIIPYRVESVEPGVMMPELGRHLEDPGAVSLLRDWIAAMR